MMMMTMVGRRETERGRVLWPLPKNRKELTSKKAFLKTQINRSLIKNSLISYCFCRQSVSWTVVLLLVFSLLVVIAGCDDVSKAKQNFIRRRNEEKKIKYIKRGTSTKVDERLTKQRFVVSPTGGLSDQPKE